MALSIRAEDRGCGGAAGAVWRGPLVIVAQSRKRRLKIGKGDVGMIARPICSCFVLLTLVSVPPVMASTSPADLVTVTSTTVRATARSFVLADVELKNVSTQTVTAYTVSVKVRYSDGKEMSRAVTTDSVWVLSLDRLGIAAPPGSRFDPGTVAKESVSFPLDPNGGPAPQAVATALEMVALADKTVYGLPGAVLALRQSRRLDAERTGDVIDTMVSLQKAVDPRGELTRIMNEKRAALPIDETERRTGEARLRMVESAIGALLTLNRSLAEALPLYQARQAVVLEHASLTQVGRGK